MAIQPLRQPLNDNANARGPQPALIEPRVGEVLRAERDARGESLEDVCAALRIRQPYLAAIEKSDLDALPGPTYAVGFVRAYADHLGLDSGEMVRRFKAEIGGLRAETDLNFPTPLPEARVPTRGIVAFALILAGLVYAGWWTFSSEDRRVADLIPALPAEWAERLGIEAPVNAGPAAAPAPAPADGADGADGGLESVAPTPDSVAAAPVEPVQPIPEGTGQDAPGRAAVDPVAPLAEATPPSGDAAGTAPETPAVEADATRAAPQTDPDATGGPAVAAPTPVDVGAPAAEDAADAVVPDRPEPPAAAGPPVPTPRPDAPESAPPAGPAGRVFGAENADARIVLTAVADAWVEIRDAQDALLLTRVLRAGDVYYVPDQPGIRLQTGNAGALNFTVDGQDVAPIGPAGAVRRNVPLEPEALRAGPRDG